MSDSITDLFLLLNNVEENASNIMTDELGKKIITKIMEENNYDLYDKYKNLVEFGVFKNVTVNTIIKEFTQNISDYKGNQNKFIINENSGIPTLKLDTKQKKDNIMTFKPYGYLYMSSILNVLCHLIYEGIIKKNYILNIFNILKKSLEENDKYCIDLIDFIKYLYPEISDTWIYELKKPIPLEEKNKIIKSCDELVHSLPKYKSRVSNVINSLNDIIFTDNEKMRSLLKTVDIKLIAILDKTYSYYTLEYLLAMARAKYNDVLNESLILNKYKMDYVNKSSSNLLLNITNWLKNNPEFKDLEFDNNFIHQILFILYFFIEEVLTDIKDEFLRNINVTKYSIGYNEIYKSIQRLNIFNKDDLDNYIYRIYYIFVYGSKIHTKEPKETKKNENLLDKAINELNNN